jgi:hypothetical protein
MVLWKGISNEFKNHFNNLFDRNEHLMPDILGKRHGINSIFVLALEKALREQEVTFEELKENILAIYRTLLQDLLSSQVETLESSDDVWNSFVKMVKAGNKQLYENKYFKLKVIQDDEKMFGFDINRCLYFEICRENGLPELGTILCDYDYILASNIYTWIKFKRTKTIVNGKEICNFRYFRAE